jgi:hypothetical protein
MLYEYCTNGHLLAWSGVKLKVFIKISSIMPGDNIFNAFISGLDDPISHLLLNEMNFLNLCVGDSRKYNAQVNLLSK